MHLRRCTTKMETKFWKPRGLMATMPSTRGPKLGMPKARGGLSKQRIIGIVPRVLCKGTDRSQGQYQPLTELTLENDASVLPTSGDGTLFSAIALITGSTVGAGMLALPAVTAPAGFIPTAAGLSATWLLLTLEALLLAEVNLTLMDRQQSRDRREHASLVNQESPTDAASSPPRLITLREMAEETLGAPGKAVTLVYLALSYGLLVAYLTKAAEVLDFFAGHALPPPLAATAFVGAAGALFLGGGPAAADRLNQALTSGLLVLFAGIITVGFSQQDVPAALASQPAVWTAVTPALPILFLSLVYHDLVPLICSMLGGHRGTIRSALVLGSLIPLGMFLSWEAVALSLVPVEIPHGIESANVMEVAMPIASQTLSQQPTMVSTTTAVVTAIEVADGMGAPLTVDPLQLFVHKSGPVMGSVVQGFSFLAVLTSFLGTTLGLSETLYSEVPPLVRQAGRFLGSPAMESYDAESYTNSACRSNKGEPTIEGGQPVAVDKACTDGQLSFRINSGRALALALCLLPPLAFTTENPDAFLAVLSLAGGTGMTMLYGVMPPLMAWKLRRQHATTQPFEAESSVHVMLPGGAPVLATLLAAAVGVGLTRVVAEGTEPAVPVVTAVVDTVATSTAAMQAHLITNL
jgi:tyrosine-specific transport protein